VSWFALPQKSAVDVQYRFDAEKNTIPGNRNTEEHVDYIFNHVVQELVDENATLDVIGVSEGAVRVSVFLESDENFKKWGKRVDAFASIASYFLAHEINNNAFAKWFREVKFVSRNIGLSLMFWQRGRVFLVSEEPCGYFLAGPEGGRHIGAYGCPAFSLGESYYAETILPKGYKTVIDWFQEVAAHPHYANPNFVRFNDDSEEEEPQEPGIDLQEKPITDRVEEIE
jgi:hypothetical protein